MTPSSPGDGEGDPLRLPGEVVVEVGRGRDDLVADPVELGRRDDRVRRGLPARRARDQRGQLAAEVDPLLGEQPDPGRLGRGERVVAVGGRGHEPARPCRRTRRGSS